MRNTKNMAFIVCTMLLLVVMTNANAIVLCDDDNTKTIIYDYDAAGNRISRGGEINNAKQRSRITGDGEDIAEIMQKDGTDARYIIGLNPTIKPADCTVSIYDLSGQFLGSKSFITNSTEVDISELRSGCYIVKIAVGSATCSFKIIK
ncbi:T9SS type A sorting domain-containing protein [Prevotella sp. PCHR]|uniref:T9SS type A sorting domain-containing protein n=1 Tax=Xylanibacter caecicola TaxID=2736294 RepID=A0ABX2B2K2_9BACT|nr:T9SS type A sorting domain-containing protein [Xylanibacter caecicola]NPE25506.1 T9SS type A sorting domain-containing protein [Xylanibacter caecicola]